MRRTGCGRTAPGHGRHGGQGNDSFTINGSVSSGLGMNQPGGDWMARRRRSRRFRRPGHGRRNARRHARNGRRSECAAGGGGGPGGGRGWWPRWRWRRLAARWTRRWGGMMGGMPNIGGRGGGRGRGGPGGRNPGAFGNNRRDPRSRYNFSASLNNFTNAVLDARQYSVTGKQLPKPDNPDHPSDFDCRRTAEDSAYFRHQGQGHVHHQLFAYAQSQCAHIQRPGPDRRQKTGISVPPLYHVRARLQHHSGQINPAAGAGEILSRAERRGRRQQRISTTPPQLPATPIRTTSTRV
jgi:hypothetical protein